MGVQLRALDAGGNYSEELPDWSDLTFSQDLIDTGALSFNYSPLGRHFDLLKHGVQLAVQVDGHEPKNGRFTYFEGTGSRINRADPNTYACTSNRARCDKLMLAPAYGSTVANEDMFDWTNYSPGQMTRTALSNAMSRADTHTGNAVSSWMVTPPTTFSNTLDSSGTLWPANYDRRVPPGTNVNEVISWLTQNGFAEAAMQGKELLLYQPETNGTDYTVGTNPLILQSGKDLTEASYQTSSTDLVTALLVLGDENSCAWVYDAPAILLYGYREGKLQVSGASTQSTLIAAGNAWLKLHKEPRWSYTYAVGVRYLEQPADSAWPRPFVEYEVGDSIFIWDEERPQKQRLRLLSATWPNSRSSILALTVNDWFQELDIRYERALSQLGLAT